MRLRQLASPLLALTCVVLSSPSSSAAAAPPPPTDKGVSAEHELRRLTDANFTASTAQGMWLVEHFSPHCPHCNHFFPTWEKLAKENRHLEDRTGFYMAQVDCTAQGDLCKSNGVKEYPQIMLFQDGTKIDIYTGDRSHDHLTSYIAQHSTDYARRPALPAAKAASGDSVVAGAVLPNPEGKVLELADSTFAKAVGAKGDGKLVWIKFFAPWCTHCKHLAPTWKQLAGLFKNQLTIAEVDCDAHQALCQREGVRAYPTLSFYADGQNVDYKGSRTLEALQKWGKKASSPGVIDITLDDFARVAKDNEVFYLFLHTFGTPKDDVDAVSRAVHSFIGGPPVFRSRDPTLFEKLSLSSHSDAYLLAFKDHSTVPVAHLPLSHVTKSPLSVAERQTAVGHWLADNKLPTVVDISTVFSDIMHSPRHVFVVLVALDPASPDADTHREKLREVAVAWRKGGRTMGDGAGVGGGTVFAWADGKKYKGWLKSTYGIKPKNYPAVVVADPSRMEYYNVDLDLQPTILDGPSIFSTLEGAYQGFLRPKSSHNFAERFAFRIRDAFLAVEAAIRAHPIKIFLGFVASLVGLYVWLQRPSNVRGAGGGRKGAVLWGEKGGYSPGSGRRID